MHHKPMISSSTRPDRRGRSSRPIDAKEKLEVFYDGDCPLCKREINMLRWMDRKNRIVFTNIAHENFDPAAYGKDQRSLMSELHARLPGGEWVTGVEAFRQIYAAVGLALPAKLSRVPGVSHALELGYRVFARNRLRLTSRGCDACAT